MSEDLTAAVAEALKSVIDPELGYNIVDLGMVYDIAVENGAAHIRMTTTRPGCPATNALKHGAEEAAGAVPGLSSVEVSMTWLPPWSPELMSEAAKAHFGFA
ncbi:MAG: metal-sulfur cluster assembly factor [Stellaceae bacterium]